MSDFALLVHTCDRYRFLYKGFNIFFNKYWDNNIPTKNYFATEEKPAELVGFSNIRTGKGEWSDRLLRILSSINEDYIIYMQEDMWLSKHVSTDFFNELFSYVKKNEPDLVKLHSSEVYSTVETGKYIKGFSLTEIDNRRSDYLMSHQISLWKKSFLMDQLRNNEHPWRNEREGSKRLKRSNPKLYQIDYFSENGKAELNCNPDDSLRSEYFTISVNAMLDFRVFIFIQMLRNSGEEQKYCDELIEHFEKGLTHDLAAHPRKPDVFKRYSGMLRKMILGF